MKTMTLQEAQSDLGHLFDLIDKGEDVCVERYPGSKFRIALLPVVEAATATFTWPAFAARRQRIFGDKIIPGNPVIEERESYDR